MIKIAVMGYGVVGSGVVEVFYKNHESIQKKAGMQLDVAHILDLREFPGDPHEALFTKDFHDILNDDEVKIVVETMGGLQPAYDFVKACLLAGKSVATSNKELVATKGDELLKIAKEKNVNFLFEASVGGGIPIIRPITQCLAANEICEIYGILNGTTNYILTQMIHSGVSFEDALKKAQELGYAEKDPTADVEGHDACRKICILSALAFGKHVYPEQVYTEGITKIALSDVAFCESAGMVIKLIGKTARISEDKVFASVYPAVISSHSQLATVDDVYNAVMVRGDAIGDVVFYGRGAGKLPTASAVVADVIDCAKHLTSRKYVSWESGCDGYVEDYKQDSIAMYVRMKADKSDVEKAFGKVRFLENKNADNGEIAFITDGMKEQAFDNLISLVNGEVLSKIRVLDI
ncbi:MAG: homoserine dehydrogenase [Acutalibacteraceae bacterium]|nr:homoserine dehydrogenase [Acutalibacteraceae bacterium]